MNLVRIKQKQAPPAWSVAAKPDDRNGTMVIRVSGPPHRHLHWVASDGQRRSQIVIVIGGPV